MVNAKIYKCHGFLEVPSCNPCMFFALPRRFFYEFDKNFVLLFSLYKLLCFYLLDQRIFTQSFLRYRCDLCRRSIILLIACINLCGKNFGAEFKLVVRVRVILASSNLLKALFRLSIPSISFVIRLLAKRFKDFQI
jgi:hypothetical protein